MYGLGTMMFPRQGAWIFCCCAWLKREHAGPNGERFKR